MNITLLAQSLVGLVLLLALLMFVLLYGFKTKKISKKKDLKTTSAVRDTSLEALRKIIRNKKTSTKELQEVLDLVLKHHGTIHPKLGSRTHPDFDSYSEILFSIARHQHINKEILLKFDKELARRNPTYKKEINEALMRGLNSRGF